jgi:hypothetical protein
VHDRVVFGDVFEDAVEVDLLLEEGAQQGSALDAGDGKHRGVVEGGEWSVVLDDDGLVASAFGIPKVPESYLVTPSGRVAVKFTGGVTRDGLDRAIDQLQRAAAEGQTP